MLITLRKHTVVGKLKEKGSAKRQVCEHHSLVLSSASSHNMTSLAINARAQYRGVTSRLHKNDDSSRNHRF